MIDGSLTAAARSTNPGQPAMSAALRLGTYFREGSEGLRAGLLGQRPRAITQSRGQVAPWSAIAEARAGSTTDDIEALNSTLRGAHERAATPPPTTRRWNCLSGAKPRRRGLERPPRNWFEAQTQFRPQFRRDVHPPISKPACPTEFLTLPFSARLNWTRSANSAGGQPHWRADTCRPRPSSGFVERFSRTNRSAHTADGHDVTRFEGRNQQLLDIERGPLAVLVDRSATARIQTIVTQCHQDDQ